MLSLPKIFGGSHLPKGRLHPAEVRTIVVDLAGAALVVKVFAPAVFLRDRTNGADRTVPGGASAMCGGDAILDISAFQSERVGGTPRAAEA